MSDRKPLSGISVLDFSAVYAGPICARMLSDLGASVIKIEQPASRGDITRASNRMFAHFNAGKRCIAVDLSSSRGREIVLSLMARVDVVVENFRPGVMARLRLDYDSVAERFAQLVYCSISGFGQVGPQSQRAAYAPIAHAASGYDYAHTIAQTDQQPANSSIMIADILTGSYAFGAIQTALLARVGSGRGDHIDVTMVESMMTLIPGQIQASQVPGAPMIGGFRPIAVADGHVMLCIVSERNFHALVEVLGKPAMRDNPLFAPGERMRNYDQFQAEIEAVTRNWSAAECEEKMNAGGVPCTQYRHPNELFDDDQLKLRGAFTQFEDHRGSYQVQNVPFKLRNGDTETQPNAAELGQHTAEVLELDLGFAAAEIDKLRAEQIVQ